MKHEAVTNSLELVRMMRDDLIALKTMLDEQPLQVGDRNVIERSLVTVGGEIEVLSRTLTDMLNDPTKAS